MDKISTPNQFVVIVIICDQILQKRALFQDKTTATWIVKCIHFKNCDYYSKVKISEIQELLAVALSDCEQD